MNAVRRSVLEDLRELLTRIRGFCFISRTAERERTEIVFRFAENPVSLQAVDEEENGRRAKLLSVAPPAELHRDFVDRIAGRPPFDEIDFLRQHFFELAERARKRAVGRRCIADHKLRIPHLRRVPELEFRLDESIANQDRIEQILRDIHEEDAQRASETGSPIPDPESPDHGDSGQ